MGACVGSGTRGRSLSDKKAIQNAQGAEQMLLEAMFTDLAERSPAKVVTKETFLNFFHDKGFWGDYMFNFFLGKQHKELNLQVFFLGLKKFFKISEIDRHKLIYRFLQEVDPQNKSGITYNSLVSILLNCPREDLEKLLNDPLFLNRVIEKEIEEKYQSSTNAPTHQEICSPQIKQNIESNNLEIPAQLEIQASSCSTEQRLPSMFGFKNLVEDAKKQMKSQSYYFTEGTFRGRPFKVMTNDFKGAIKKFAKQIFDESQTDPKTQSLSFQKFSKFLTHHQNFFNFYYNGFHQYVWSVEADDQGFVPGFHEENFTLKSIAQFNNIKSTLFVLKPNSLGYPLKIINLEGLIVSEYLYDQKYGFSVTHKDNYYKPKRFLFDTPECKQIWLAALSNYQQSDVTLKYTLGKKIGAGQHSVVHEAKINKTKEKCAIKKLIRSSMDQKSENYLLRESKIMAMFDSPYLIKYYETIETKEYTYVVTELAGNCVDLYDFIYYNKSKLTQKTAAHIIRQILIGTKHMHDKGILHRDLKPQNVVVAQNCENPEDLKVKIIDFGLSLSLQECNCSDGDSNIAGSPGYLAPESITSGILSTKTDSYSIGCIIYFMFTGIVPFDDPPKNGVRYEGSIRAMLMRVLEGDLYFSEQVWSGLSPSLKDLVQKLMQINPEERLSVSDALYHDWFRTTNQSSE